jgi:hypothetical protein
MFFRDYFRVLIPLLLLFGIYSVVVGPLLESNQHAQAAKRWNTPAIPTRSDWWESMFKEGDWQRQSPRVVRTSTGILLFQSREQVTQTSWKLKPITILVPQKGEGGGSQAIVIQNRDGATINFEYEVEWTKPLPPVKTGLLDGDISIFSPPSPGNNRDGIRIQTRNIRIDKRVIWTDQNIEMALGNSRIEGSSLEIHLDKDLLASDSTTSAKSTPFNGLDHLKLFNVDRVYLGLENGGLWPSKTVADALIRPAHATLKCAGTFEFQFNQSKAILRNGVHMEHIVQGLPIDTFDCNELQLQVGWNQKTASANQATSGANWKVERLEAFGATGRDHQDRSRWLKLNAPGMQAEAEGQHLVMDMLGGMVTLSNKLPGTIAKDSSLVYLKRETLQVRAPFVQYVNPEAIAPAGPGSVASSPREAKRIGALQADGVGSAILESSGEKWKLSWGQRLIIRPDKDEDLLTIEGSANISNQIAEQRFVAERLDLWFKPTTPEVQRQLEPRFGIGKVPQFLPDRMWANGDVKVDSPQLRAAVEEMQVWFAFPIVSNVPQPEPVAAQAATTQSMAAPVGTSGANPVAPNPSELPRLGLASSTGPVPGPLLQPAGPNSSTPGMPSHPPHANSLMARSATSPLNVTAKRMMARVVNSGTESFIDGMTLEGSFSLTKNQISPESPWPFSAVGEKLQLSQNTREATDVRIIGWPDKEAKVSIGSGFVLAPSLYLKQSENLFTIDHPGTIVIPAEALEQNAAPQMTGLLTLPVSSSSNGFVPAPSARPRVANSVRWRELPKIRWGQAMVFNGKTARFSGQVSIEARVETDPTTLWHIAATAEEMLVDMVHGIPLRSVNDQQPSSPAMVNQIQLKGNVDLRTSQTDHRLVRRSLEHMKVPELDFIVPTQTWVAMGPGELWSRRAGAGASLPTGFSATGSVPPPKANDESSLQCIHLSFMGRMEGALQQRQATFYDRIEALMGPIVSWDDEVNVHRTERLGRNQTRLISDQLNIFDATGLSWNQPNQAHGTNKANWELAAQSRVTMTSNTDKGELVVIADRLSYAAANDVVRAERSPRQSAKIILPTGPSEPPTELQVSSAALRLKTGELDMQISKLEGALPRSMQPSSPQNSITPSGQNVSTLPLTGKQDNSQAPLSSPRDTPFAPKPR